MRETRAYVASAVSEKRRQEDDGLSLEGYINLACGLFGFFINSAHRTPSWLEIALV